MPGKALTRASRTKGSMKLFVGVVAVGFIASAGSVALGMADKGQIDVSATIANSNIERRTNDDTTDDVQVPIPRDNPTNAPNGGLVGQGKPPAPEPVSEVEGTSTTTSEGSEGVVDENSESAETELDPEDSTEEQ